MPGLAAIWRRRQNRNGGRSSLAFILLNLRSLQDRRSAERELVDLLFFPTGGGKTEAYLGLAAFAIAHRRLTWLQGVLGAGVTIMRYTLRLADARSAVTRRRRRARHGAYAHRPKNDER